MEIRSKYLVHKLSRGKAAAWKRRARAGSHLLLRLTVGLGVNTEVRLMDASVRAVCGRCVEAYDAKSTTDARTDNIRMHLTHADQSLAGRAGNRKLRAFLRAELPKAGTW